MKENLNPGDRVQFVNLPSEMSREAFGSEPTDTEAEVVDIVEETKHTGVDSKIEQELAILETDAGERHRVNTDHTNSELDAQAGGVTMRPLDSGPDIGRDTFFGTPPTRPTDIGREPDGEFDSPDTKDDVRPAPIDRNTETGRFGVDPFDLTSGGFGDGLDLFGGDRK